MSTKYPITPENFPFPFPVKLPTLLSHTQALTTLILYHHRLVWSLSELDMHSLVCSLFLPLYFLRCIHVIKCINSMFLFITEWYFIIWIDHRRFIVSSVDGHFCYFSLGLLWKKLSWASLEKSTYGKMHSFFLEWNTLGVELLNQSSENANIFNSVCTF